jgi:hypothetical protein
LLFDYRGAGLLEFLDLSFQLHQLLVVVFGLGQLAVEFVLEFLVVFLFGFKVRFEGLNMSSDLFELFPFL